MEHIIRFSVNLFDLGMFWYYLNSFKKMKPVPNILFVVYIMAMAAIWSDINALNHPFLNLLILVSVLLITSLFFESAMWSRLVNIVVFVGIGMIIEPVGLEETDKVVLTALKQQIRLFMKEAELSKNARNKTIPYSEGAEIATLIKTIATMKKTWMPLYEQYTDGKLSREDFLVEKKKYDEETARLEQRLYELQSRQEIQQESNQQIEKNISQLNCYVDQMELTEEIKEKLIDKVNVYSDNRIEICWNFESGFLDMETMHKCG